MRRFDHWTTHYVVSRMKLVVYQRLHPRAPWLTAGAIQLLDAWLRPVHCGVEWGSGRSTIWFAERVAHLTSIEHDPVWFEEVQRKLEKKSLTGKVVGRRLSIGGGDSAYVRVVETLPNESLDFALVDGKERDCCAVAAIPKLRPGGLLIVDNVERYLPHYRDAQRPPEALRGDVPATTTWGDFAERTRSWTCTWTTNGVWDTALWVKP